MTPALASASDRFADTDHVPTIGMIVPPKPDTVPPEPLKLYPEGVRFRAKGLGLTSLTPEGYDQVIGRIAKASAELAEEGADAIALMGTSISFYRGPAFNAELVASMEKASGLPATTMSNAVVDALSTLGAKRLAVATAYGDEVNDRLAAYLGEVFDIHGGGLDLIFPHHENEIAQSRCAHGTDVMANYWMHNGFLQVEGRKMSKSEGNFVTIHELLETEKFGGRKWPGEVLRLAMLMTHYREPIDFSVRRLEEAENIHRGLYRHFGGYRVGELGFLDKPSSAVIASLCDDLHFGEGLLELQRLGKNASTSREAASILGSTLGLLGLLKPNIQPEFDQGKSVLIESVPGSVVPPDIEVHIASRLAFIADKNWAEADRIRDELLAQGIQLKDGKDPETGKRITTWELKR